MSGPATTRCPVTTKHNSYICVCVCVSQFQSIALDFRFFFSYLLLWAPPHARSAATPPSISIWVLFLNFLNRKKRVHAQNARRWCRDRGLTYVNHRAYCSVYFVLGLIVIQNLRSRLQWFICILHMRHNFFYPVFCSVRSRECVGRLLQMFFL